MSEANLTQQILDLFDNSQLTLQEISDSLGTTYKVVWNRVYKYRTEEQRKLRKVINYQKSKLGKNNPMFGKTGKLHHNYIGACSDNKGYLTVVKPEWYAKNCRRVFLHHVVLAEHMGINRIPKGFVVHHLDHNPLNNSVDNLVMLTPSAHTKLHHLERAETTRVRARVTDSASDE